MSEPAPGRNIENLPGGLGRTDRPAPAGGAAGRHSPVNGPGEGPLLFRDLDIRFRTQGLHQVLVVLLAQGTP
jgi:hypothetical protein